MADDRLELIASVKNLTSGPIRDIQRSMRALAAQTSGAHKLGTLQAKGHAEALYQLRREVGSVAERVRTGFAPAMSALGISSIGAAAGVAALTKSLVDFAGNARHLEFMSKQTQLTVNQLRGWEQEAARLGTTSESLTGSFVEFNSQMEKMARMGRTFGKEFGIRTEMQELQSTLKLLRPAEISGLVRSLQGLSREAQVEKILKFADKIPDIAKRMELLKAFHLDPALANKQSAEVLKDLDEIEKRLGKLTEKQLKAGTDFQESIERIKDALVGLRDAIGADLAKDMGEVADALAEFAKVHGKDIASDLREVITAAAAAVKEIAGISDALNKLSHGEPIDLSSLIDFEGLKQHLDEFIATWESRWTKFKEFLKGTAPGTPASPNEMGSEWSGAPGAPIVPPTNYPPAGQGYGGGRSGGGGADTRPLWRRLFDMTGNEAGGGGIKPASFQVPDDWRGALKSPGAGDPRAAEGVIERGVLSALRDFAAEQKGLAGGAGGGGGSPGMAAIRTAYSPSGGGPGGPGQPAGEPSTDGGADTGQRPSSDPMGSLGGKPVGVTSIGAAGGKTTGWWTPERQQHAVSSLMKGAGLSEMGARGLVSRWANVEAAGGPGEVNRSSGAAGIAQWLGDRKHGFKLGDFDSQLAKAARELNTTEKSAGDALRSAKTPDEAAVGASRFERAEGYNRRTGRDNFTNRTAKGIAGIAGGGMPHFSVADVRKSVEGSPGGPGAATGPWRDQAGHHYYEHGSVSLGGQNYHWGSGGAGAGALPFGSYPINIGKGDIGPIGQRIGSVATLGNLGGEFTGGGHHWAGVQMHRAFSDRLDHLYTQGCFSIAASEWPAYKQKLIEENAKTPGGLQLNVGPNGMASITARGKPNQNLVPPHAADPKSPKRAEAINLRRPHGTAGGVKSGILPFGESPNAEELRKLGRPNFGHRQHADLLGHARQAGIVGAPMQHKVTGSAHLKIDVNGPAGTQAKMAKMDGMFRTVQISRGRAMTPAHQDG